MDTRSELAWERVALAKADLHLRQGQRRLDLQEALVLSLRDRMGQVPEAERLLALLRETMIHWQHHRVLIEHRIAYLKVRLAAEAEAEAADRGGVAG